MISFTDMKGKSSNLTKQNFFLKENEKRALVALGYTQIKQANYKSSLVIFECINNLFPNEVEIYKYLAFLYMETGYYEKSIRASQTYMEWAEESSKNTPIMFIKSLSLWELGLRKEASEIMQRYMATKNIL